jgi:hypothetical protein
MSKHVVVHMSAQGQSRRGQYRQTFHVEYEPGMNMTTVLQRIAANPVTRGREHHPGRLRRVLPGRGLRGVQHA